jgi:hypothetical protein
MSIICGYANLHKVLVLLGLLSINLRSKRIFNSRQKNDQKRKVYKNFCLNIFIFGGCEVFQFKISNRKELIICYLVHFLKSLHKKNKKHSVKRTKIYGA